MKTEFIKYTMGVLLILINLVSIQAQTLDDYLKEAAENNPGVKASYTEFEMSLQRVTQANSLPDPTLSIGVFLSPVETRVGPQRARISLSQMFPWFGTLKTKEKIAHATAEAKFQEFLTAKNELFLNVKKSYYPLVELQELVRLHQENLNILETSKQLALQAYSNGKGSMTDVLRVEIMMEDVKTELMLLQEKSKPLTVSFNRLLNRADSMEVKTSVVEKPITEEINTSKDSLWLQNTVLKSIDAQLLAAQANETFSKKKALPQFGLGLDYVLIGKRTDMNVPDNGKNAIMPMFSMSLPIFRGKYKASIKEAELMTTGVLLKKENIQNNLISNYEFWEYELHKNFQNLVLYDSQIQKTKQILDLLYTAYSTSGKEFVEVLRTQQQQLKYEIASVSAIKNYYLALAQLEFITSK